MAMCQGPDERVAFENDNVMIKLNDQYISQLVIYREKEKQRIN